MILSTEISLKKKIDLEKGKIG